MLTHPDTAHDALRLQHQDLLAEAERYRLASKADATSRQRSRPRFEAMCRGFLSALNSISQWIDLAVAIRRLRPGAVR